jgi:hypothetical protein
MSSCDAVNEDIYLPSLCKSILPSCFLEPLKQRYIKHCRLEERKISLKKYASFQNTYPELSLDFMTLHKAITHL